MTDTKNDTMNTEIQEMINGIIEHIEGEVFDGLAPNLKDECLRRNMTLEQTNAVMTSLFRQIALNFDMVGDDAIQSISNSLSFKRAQSSEKSIHS